MMPRPDSTRALLEPMLIDDTSRGRSRAQGIRRRAPWRALLAERPAASGSTPSRGAACQ